MKEKSIELLNKAIADELSAVHQYMYFHFHCDDLGYDLLSNLFKRTAIEEMMHVEKLAERILFLKGEVEMKASHDVQKIHDVKKIFEALVDDEERHYDQYDKEMENLVRFGDSYLALQSIERSKSNAAGKPTE
jgi:bacterioferritin